MAVAFGMDGSKDAGLDANMIKLIKLVELVELVKKAGHSHTGISVCSGSKVGDSRDHRRIYTITKSARGTT